MNEEAVQRIIQSNNDQLMAQITTLIPNFTVQGLKRSNEDQAQEQLQQIKKLKYDDTPAFKKKSNEDQYKI